MKKQKIIIIGIFISCSLFINNISFAQETNECKVCRTSSEEFDMILNMTNEMVNYIKTIGKEGNYIGDYINPNRYEGNKFNPPTTKKRLTNLVLQSESLITTTALIVSPKKIGGLEDYLFGFMLLFKNKVFPRDYKKILDTEGRISDKIYELGLGGGYYSKINKENIKDIEKILNKYKDKGLLLDFYIDESTKYKDIVSQGNQITSSLKNFLATKNIKQFFKFNGAITLNINPAKINDMKTAYECSNECNELGKKVGENIKNLNNATKTSVKSSIDTIKKSFKKFKDEIGEIKVKNAFKNTIKINGHTGTIKEIKNIGEATKGNEKKLEVKEIIKDNKTEIEQQKIENPTNNKAILTNSILGVISSHKADLNYAIVTETKNSNYLFEKLSKTVNRNIDIVKEFRKELEDAANLQCSK